MGDIPRRAQRQPGGIAMTPAMLRPLTTGEVLDTAFSLYRESFVALLTVSLATQFLPLAISGYVETTGGFLVNPGLWFVAAVLGFIAGAIGTAAATFIVSDSYLGHQITTGEAFARATPFLGRLVGYSFLSSLIIGLGMLMLIVPGFIFLCGFAVGAPALVLESLPSATGAMGRSWELTKGYRGKIFAVLFTTIVLLLIPTIGVGALVAIFGPGEGESAVLIASLVITAIIQILVAPFIYVAFTVLYYDLRVRKEGFDLEMLTTALNE
jgi:hypothetical protein